MSPTFDFEFMRFDELVADKTVALVGNAVSSMEQKNGAAIDSHDVVIRCNRSFLRLHPETIGKRLDILFLGSPGQSQDYMGADLSKVKAFVWTKNAESGKRLARSCPYILHHPGLIYYDMNLKEGLTSKLGALPSSGFMAFWWLLLSDCARISVFGFDFFRTGTAYSGLNRATKWHKPDAEKAHIERAIADDPRRIILFHC